MELWPSPLSKPPLLWTTRFISTSKSVQLCVLLGGTVSVLRTNRRSGSGAGLGLGWWRILNSRFWKIPQLKHFRTSNLDYGYLWASAEPYVGERRASWPFLRLRGCVKGVFTVWASCLASSPKLLAQKNREKHTNVHKKFTKPAYQRDIQVNVIRVKNRLLKLAMSIPYFAYPTQPNPNTCNCTPVFFLYKGTLSLKGAIIMLLAANKRRHARLIDTPLKNRMAVLERHCLMIM